MSIYQRARGEVMIIIGSDHAGYKLKELIKGYLSEIGENYKDVGTNSEESCDYPDYAYKLGNGILSNEVDFGVAICGSGIGISIACNKVKGIRCAKVVNKEEAIVTRNDNNSNIVAFGENMPLAQAFEIVINFISTPFSDEEKHHRRVDKIIKYEEDHYDR